MIIKKIVNKKIESLREEKALYYEDLYKLTIGLSDDENIKMKNSFGYQKIQLIISVIDVKIKLLEAFYDN